MFIGSEASIALQKCLLIIILELIFLLIDPGICKYIKKVLDNDRKYVDEFCTTINNSDIT